MNGKGMTYLMVLLILGNFSFTLGTYVLEQQALDQAVADRNERIKALGVLQDIRWAWTGTKFDREDEALQDARDRLRTLECAQGLPSCVPVRYNGSGK